MRHPTPTLRTLTLLPILTLLVLLLPATHALPTVHPSTASPSTVGAVYICLSENFSKDCEYYLPSELAICQPTDPKHPIKSLGPDQGTTCFTYANNQCKKVQDTIVWPGISKGLRAFGSMHCGPSKHP